MSNRELFLVGPMASPNTPVRRGVSRFNQLWHWECLPHHRDVSYNIPVGIFRHLDTMISGKSSPRLAIACPRPHPMCRYPLQNSIGKMYCLYSAAPICPRITAAASQGMIPRRSYYSTHWESPPRNPASPSNSLRRSSVSCGLRLSWRLFSSELLNPPPTQEVHTEVCWGSNHFFQFWTYHDYSALQHYRRFVQFENREMFLMHLILIFPFRTPRNHQ